MADHNANKITVQVQVEPTSEAPETSSLQPTASAGARSEARRTQPEKDTPNAVTSGPPTAVDNKEGLQAAAPVELEQIELDDSILNLMPGEMDDFTEVNMDFAAALLEDDGEEIAQHIAETYNPGAEKAHPGQDYPELEIGVDGLNLGDSGSDPEEPPWEESTPAAPTAPTGTPAREPAPVSEEVEMEEKGEPLHDQPGLRIEEKRIQIRDIGLFRRRTGQPVWLRAYPWVRHAAIPPIPGKPQVYTGQDHHDPTGLYPCSTRKERQQAREIERRTASKDTDYPTYNPGQPLECHRYAEETLITRQDQPWAWDLEVVADYYSLERCGDATMEAILDSGMLPRTEGGFNPVTPSYLTVVLDQDKALLTAQEATTVSMAFPYARGRRQEPLSLRILINDLYWIPLYQPSVGPMEPGQLTGARAAAAIIRDTGADPNFVMVRVIGRTQKPWRYEVAYRPDVDPGPMRYVCRADDCRAFGTARLSFTTEEELVCHWNTFHVAVLPQFTCQHPKCNVVFAAGPGSLDRYLTHIERCRKEAAEARVPLQQRHSYEVKERAVTVKPNPYYKPPGPQDETPQRMAQVIAPPVYRYSGNPRDNVRNLRWAYRKIFEKKIRQAMEQPAAPEPRKRRRSDASLTRPDGTKRRHKSGSSEGKSYHRRESGGTSASSSSSRSTFRSPQPGPSKMPRIQLKIKRCQQPGAGNKMAKTTTSPRKAGRHRRPSTASTGPQDGSGRQPRVSSQGEVRVTVPNEADPFRDGPIHKRLTWKEPSRLALTQPTAQPRDRATWNSLCVATDFETGQLQGEVGTPKNPGFTYEEAVHNRWSGQAMTLHVGEDIVQQESEELIRRSRPKLKQLMMDVEASQLPLLPQGMLPGGWDALGRPWALMDCPAEQVPQIPSAHDQLRVTVAMLMSFPPEPLYFPSREHMDCALRV